MEMERSLSQYDRMVIMGLEQQIQYHEAMKKNHDEAIAKAKARIEGIEAKTVAVAA